MVSENVIIFVVLNKQRVNMPVKKQK